MPPSRPRSRRRRRVKSACESVNPRTRNCPQGEAACALRAGFRPLAGQKPRPTGCGLHWMRPSSDVVRSGCRPFLMARHLGPAHRRLLLLKVCLIGRTARNRGPHPVGRGFRPAGRPLFQRPISVGRPGNFDCPAGASCVPRAAAPGGRGLAPRAAAWRSTCTISPVHIGPRRRKRMATFELGYALSSEEHDPQHLVRWAQRAEAAGFTFALISDHSRSACCRSFADGAR